MSTTDYIAEPHTLCYANMYEPAWKHTVLSQLDAQLRGRPGTPCAREYVDLNPFKGHSDPSSRQHFEAATPVHLRPSMCSTVGWREDLVLPKRVAFMAC